MDAYIGTIMMWAPNFAPLGWSYCNGALVAIAQNQALFALLSTTYGGNGSTTFGLPDLRSRAPMGAGMGQGPGLSTYTLGTMAGVENVTLITTQMPQHNHPATAVLVANNTPGTSASPVAGGVLANGVADVNFEEGQAKIYASAAGSTVTLAPGSIAAQVGFTGSGMPHENRMPFTGVSFIIAVQGIFPPRP